MLFQQNLDVPKDGYEDMVNMAEMSEAEILSNINLRYLLDKIFTYIGPTLLVMNPYKSLPDNFSDDMLNSFKLQVINPKNFTLKDNSPHVFAISALSYWQIFKNLKNQAIVISGESGAGKTENAKYAMKFLTSLSSTEDSLMPRRRTKTKSIINKAQGLEKLKIN